MDTPPSVEPSPSDGRPLRILVVEDHVILADALQRYLGSCNHLVECAGDVKSARRALAEETFDVVLADIELPDGEAPDLFAELKESLPPLIVTMSAFDHAWPAGLGSEMPAKRHLRKPFQVEELDSLLDDFARQLERKAYVSKRAAVAQTLASGRERLPGLVRAILREAARLRAAGLLSQPAFEAKLERLSREELAPKALELEIEERAEGTRFLIKGKGPPALCEVVDCL